MKDETVSWDFHRYGDNRETSVRFTLHRDVSWSEILPFFLDFLHANGYVIDSNHELYEMCTYDHCVE